jgi:hypothetical protein
MKTLKLFIVLIIVIAFFGDFVNVDINAQTLRTINVQKKSEIEFWFEYQSNQNYFDKMEVVNNDNYFIKGANTNNSGITSDYVALVDQSSVQWIKKVFSGTTSGDVFGGDINVYSTQSESLLYATTETGLTSFNLAGIQVATPPINLYGNKSKMVQRSNNETFLLSKVENSKVYTYRCDAITGAMRDSLLVTANTQFIQSCYFVGSANAWYLTLCLSSNKTKLVKIVNNTIAWEKTFQKTARSWVVATVDRIYLVNDSLANDYTFRTVIKCFNSSGGDCWSNIYLPESQSFSSGIALFPDGGCSVVGSTNQDIFVITYDMNGQGLWQKVFLEPNRSVNSIKWNNRKELIIGGQIGAHVYISTYFVDGVSGIKPLTWFPADIELRQNYPNPFNPLTTIGYYLPFSTNVRLTVYNQLGQEVAELVNGYQTAGQHQVAFNANNLVAGVYIVGLVSNNKLLTKKMILLK